MPRKAFNVFAKSDAPTEYLDEKGPIIIETSENAVRRPSAPRSIRLPSLWSTPPKPKSEPQTATSALLAAQNQATEKSPSPQISSPSLSLPTISLSTAKADTTNTDEPPTTLFQPPSPAEARRLSRQHAQFGPLGDHSHTYVSKFAGGNFPEVRSFAIDFSYCYNVLSLDIFSRIVSVGVSVDFRDMSSKLSLC